jgi:hypothetical protein
VLDEVLGHVRVVCTVVYGKKPNMPQPLVRDEWPHPVSIYTLASWGHVPQFNMAFFRFFRLFFRRNGRSRRRSDLWLEFFTVVLINWVKVR